MSDKTIDLNDTVYNICSAYPEIKDIMAELGFTDIVKPGMLNTAGRIMTISKGAKMKNITIDTIRNKFEANGFTIKE
ncbi:MAG: DUF1858 domain-containing protein [Clostridiaceae bacterium]|nr:DUF1858 domain-containing protein [Clostridiaceae bacterium]